MSSILEIFTKAVSTSLVIANVLIFVIDSFYLGCPLVPLLASSCDFLMLEFSRTPIVSCPSDVISSASDY